LIVFTKFLYNFLFFLGLIFGFPVIIPMVLCSSKWRRTFWPRMGFGVHATQRGKTATRPIWIHAVSVGEILAIAPLVKRLHQQDGAPEIIITTTTCTGLTLAQKCLGNTIGAVYYFPFDFPLCVKRAIQAINPILVMIVEHDIWPNFLFTLQRRQIPVILINARLSDKTFTQRQYLGFFMHTVFATFTAVGVQSPEDAARFNRLGVATNRITLTGSLKFDQPVATLTPVAQGYYRQALNLRATDKIVVAGSTAKGEEMLLAESLRQVKAVLPELILIIAPRDPRRARDVCQAFTTAGWRTVLLREITRNPTESRVEVIIIDILGILKTLYAITDVAFVGGSLINYGGHNPLEPAAHAKPILFGPDMSNFAEIAHLLEQTGGARRVADAAHCATEVRRLLQHPDSACQMGAKAFEVFQHNRGAVKRTMQMLAKYLQQ
jgi:3-deoxy-D-manno-octulosonic-acid transferase